MDGDVAEPIPAGQERELDDEGARDRHATDPPLFSFDLDLFEIEVLPTIDLPEAGTLTVDIVDENGAPIPGRVTVVGFDPSPEPTLPGASIFGLSIGPRGLFERLEKGSR